MTIRTRRFLIFGVTVLVGGLGTGLVASYAFQNFGIAGSAGPAELAYIPADSTAVAFANVRDVMDSEVRQKLLKFSPGTAPAADHFEAETGINIQTDVDRIVAATGAFDRDTPRPLLVVRGTFDTARIEALIRSKGGSVEEYGGERVIAYEQSMALSFVEPGVALVGDPGSVRRAIDTKASGADVTGNADLMRLVREMNTGNAWAVGRFDAVAGSSILPDELKQQLPPVTWLAISGHVADSVSAVLRAEARDEAAANNLRDVIRGFVALARMQASQHAPLADLVNSLELGGQGNTVSLAFSVPASLIDLLAAMRAQQSAPAAETPAAAPSL